MSDDGPRTYAFDSFELDEARFELRLDGQPIHVEPQVLSLLLLLVANRGRMVGKDEIIDRVWDGRIVSESAVAARIKAARRVIGDDGKQQKLIRTIHGRGFRFVGEADETPPVRAQVIGGDPTDPQPSPPHPGRDGRPSIAVLPFALAGDSGPHDIVADALPADIIADLSRLPWLFVIARGSSFRFGGGDVDPVRVGRELAVRYCLGGSIELSGGAVCVTVTLSDTAHGETIWAEQYRGKLVDLQAMRPEIEAQVIAGLEIYISRHEVSIARSRPANELNAWASFHLGLSHMYRFTQGDNAVAARLFEQSLARDPYFSRAMGGLSFAHFQNAFLRFGDDQTAEMEAAREMAQRAVEADRLDPFAHFNLARSFWLDGRLDASIDGFDRATNLSPSFAQGVYNRGLVSTMAGRGDKADADLALALKLSPFDPLAYAMVSSRALAHLQIGDLEKAAGFGAQAALMPGAHKHIVLIAAITAQFAGMRDEARHWLRKAREVDPELSAAHFFRAFPFAPTQAREDIERSMAELGL